MKWLGLLFLASCAAGASSKPKLRSERIGDIAADYWDLTLSTDPRKATQVGDHRFDGDLEFVSPQARATLRAAKLAIVARASAVASLSEAEMLDRDVLLRSLLAELGSEECRYPLWLLDHLEGLQSALAQLPTYHRPITREAAATLIARYRQVPRLVGEHIANLRLGLRADWTAPELNVRRVLAQIDGILAAPPFVPADAVSKGELDAVVAADVLPALREYRRVIATEILPVARKTIAVAPECYAYEILRHTGSQLSPKEINRLGLDEVARIRREMAVLDKKLKGKPRLMGKSPDAMLQNARDIVARAEAALPKAFLHLPKTKLEVRAMEAFREKESPGGEYRSAPADRSQPAIYYLNTYAADKRPLMTQEALAFHEGVPGHHLQIAIAQELVGVPAFRREEGVNVFVEGWALYAEKLAKELDLYTSDASEYGRLESELWRSKRLVVDTGMHALGWSREQALVFMREASTQPEVELVNEIDRYITWPAQALSYKLGELEFLRLRAKAQRLLGKRFDLREFHDVVLGAGALPMDILGKRVDRWIASKAD